MASKKRKSSEDDNIECKDAASAEGNNRVEAKKEEDEVDEDLDALLESLTREQLISLLRSAAASHFPTLAEVRRVADIDPAYRKLFVHGLGWDTTSDTLRAAFAPFGEIEDFRIVYDRKSGRSKGYGFVVFRHQSSARAALQSPQKHIDGRMTACQLASCGPPSLVSTHKDLNPSHQESNIPRKIYVSNVNADIDVSEFRNFFAKFGEIEEGPIGFDKQTGKPKGFALFVYKTVAGARRALEEPSKIFEGCTLFCQKATDNKSKNATPSLNAPAPLSMPLDQVYGGSTNQMGMQAGMIGQGFTGLGGMQPFTPPLLAMLAAAGQSITPGMIASINPTLAAAALGAGPQVAPQTAVPVQGYSMGNAAGFPHNAGFQGAQGFQAHQGGAQGPPYQGGLMGQSLGQRPPVTQMGGGYGSH